MSNVYNSGYQPSVQIINALGGYENLHEGVDKMVSLLVVSLSEKFLKEVYEELEQKFNPQQEYSDDLPSKEELWDITKNICS